MPKDGTHAQQGGVGASSSNSEQATGDPGDLDERIAAIVAAAVKRELPGALNASVNAAVTNHLKRAEKKAAAQPPASDGSDDDESESASTTPASTPKPAKQDPRVRSLEQQLAELKKKQEAAEAKAADMAREKLLRDAIASSGVAVLDSDAAYRILVADYEPDEEGGLRPRDAKQQGKAFGDTVKERLGGLKYLHAASGRAGGDRAGEQKPDSGEFREDPKASDEENITRWREAQGRATKATG